MRTALISALWALCLATNAAAQPLPTLTLDDLDGGHHTLPRDWSAHGGVLILGFAHNARDAMDQWVNALALQDNDAWLEAPVVGDVSGMIQPMIRGGMRARYDAARRAHVTPVFDGADAVRHLAPQPHGDVVVLIVDHSGNVAGAVDGTNTEANTARVRALMLQQ